MTTQILIDVEVPFKYGKLVTDGAFDELQDKWCTWDRGIFVGLDGYDVVSAKLMKKILNV